VEAGMPQIGDAVDIEMQTMTAEQVDFDITGCRFAEFFRALGEPELGFALLCSMDETSAEEIGGDQVRFTRTNTIMQGGSRCDFRYALKRRGAL
jgi:L-2-amino-thiazoline-4-carboxylic acid hydrolase-like protein